ncbi:response regulator [Roseovarius sp.]|uniref:response regulator n=1 Tax=Roseovarius sp. TaxID=1486281 RepID=UPI003D14823B
MFNFEHTHPEAIETVLLVDDDTFFHIACKRLMQRSGLVKTLISYPMAVDALEFLSRSDRPRVDVIFLDINMPKMNGFEFLEEAVTRFGTDFCRKIVVMLTSSLDARDVARAKACNAIDSYVNKPLSHEHIASIAGKLKAGREKLG